MRLSVNYYRSRLGAAEPGEVFATCNGDPGRVRKAVLDRFGWSQARYRALFEELFAPGATAAAIVNSEPPPAMNRRSTG